MRTLFTAAVLTLLFRAPAGAGDWPQWRGDARRSAVSAEAVPGTLHLRWLRKYPPLRPAHWQVRQVRQQFDLGYEPVVAGGTVFVASSRNDSVTALDLETGAATWRFYADGPVRLAPVVHRGRVLFGSDDGSLYCLAAGDGKLLWRRKGCPSARKVIGDGRLISVWPVRGGPVAQEGRVYFAAGVWPFEGIFVWALDADTGRTVWLNDRTGSLYLEHPHGAMAFGGPSPQGYLLIHKGELIVPSGRAFPAFFDVGTGALKEFEFGHGGHGSRPGGWFVTVDASGALHVDPEVNRDTHDEGHQRIGQERIRGNDRIKLHERVTIGTRSYRVTAGARRTVTLGGKTYDFAAGFPGVVGTVRTMLAAGGHLLVVTREGGIYCFSGKPGDPKVHEIVRHTLPRPDDVWAGKAGEILATAGQRKGYALVLGLGTGRLAEELLHQSQLHVIAVDTDEEKVDAFRRRLDAAGLYGRWAAAFAAEPGNLTLPPHFATLIVSEDSAAAKRLWPEEFSGNVLRSLRPYGGRACLPAAVGDLGKDATRKGDMLVIARDGPLAGAADYLGRPNFDERVRPPLGVLWFGDTYHHHKLFAPDPQSGFLGPIGSGLPTVVQGAIRYVISETPYGTKPRNMKQKKVPRSVYTDLYTGRAMSADELPPPRPVAEGEADRTYPSQVTRVNPMTSIREARNVMKGYGCDAQPVDYGHLYTMRSGTAAYYDKRLESGTVNISGLRSGCRNNIIPAGGVLALPYWVGNCTCNYPNYTSLALVSMPETHEQWAAWGAVAVEAPIERIGLNFGAPGDRIVENGTLWVEVPSVGGPSPAIDVAIEPSDVKFTYRHSACVRGGSGWPWVAASRVEGLRSLTVVPVARRAKATRNTYSVRWTGKLLPAVSETTTFHAVSDHGFRVWVDGKLVLDNQKDRRRGKPVTISRTAALEAGRAVPLVMEYTRPRPTAALAPGKVELAWSSASVPKDVIPSANLLTVAGEPGGITGAYYHTEDLKGPGVLRKDRQIRFDWGTQFPEPLRPPAEPVVARGRYTVRLTFAEMEDVKPGQRVFSVSLQGSRVLTNLDVVSEAGGPMRGVTKEFRGVAVKSDISLTFTPKTGQPILSGLEILAE